MRPLQNDIYHDSFGKEFISDRYLSRLFFWMLFWASTLLFVVFLIDPYGVSPLKIHLARINRYKPQRIDIDRIIKPYEVWWYQPKSIFLGTSRIHQSMDPAVMNGTQFAPAYNASIPASTLSENAAYLDAYFKMDKKLKYVFVEMFIYTFLFAQPNVADHHYREFLQNAASMFVSSDALLDAVKTVKFNWSGHQIGPYIATGGHWIRPVNFDTEDTFNRTRYVSNIVTMHKTIKDMQIHPSSIEALNKMVRLCHQHDAQLFLLITPSYPWDDYRLKKLDYWPLLTEWVKKLSTYENVYSFSQYNALLEEQPRAQMIWWNDPIHFSSHLGELMMKSLVGIPDPVIPPNLLRKVSSENAAAVVQERLDGLNAWSVRNQSFITSFDSAKKAAGHIEKRTS